MASVRRMRAESVKMTTDQTRRFINLYLSHENLWNTRSPDYTKREYRQDSYWAIAKGMSDMQLTAAKVAAKISSLRSNYSRELSKIRESATAGGEVYIPKWEFFSTFDQFLRDQVQQNKPGMGDLDSMDPQAPTEAVVEEIPETSDYIITQNHRSPSERDSNGEGAPNHADSHMAKRKMAKVTDLQIKKHILDTLSVIASRRQSHNSNEDTSIYEQYMLCAFRTLKKPQVIKKFKRGFDRLMLECREEDEC